MIGQVEGRKIRQEKPPKFDDSERVCEEADCEVRLSRYNLDRFCFVHRPVRYPRVRGRVSQ
jgi:hypothetical protein